MPLAARRLLLRSRAFNNRFLYRSSRSAPRSIITSQWHRQLSFTPRRFDDGKKPKSEKVEVVDENIKSIERDDHTEIRLKQDNGGEVHIIEAEPGFDHDTWAKSVEDGGAASLEDFQDQMDVPDQEIIRLMGKYPGIDLKMIESLKLGKIQESDLAALLKKKYPDGPPEVQFNRREAKDLDQLEEYTTLLLKLEAGGITEAEQARLKVLQDKVSKDPEIKRAIAEAVELPEEGELLSASRSELDAARAEMGVEEPISGGITSDISSKITPNMIPVIDEADIAKMSPEDQQLLREMQADPEAWEMIQMDSMVEWAESMVSGQFDEQYLQSLDREELEQLGQLQQNEEFINAMRRIPRDLKAKMEAKPEVVERAKKLGASIGFGRQRLLDLPNVDMEQLLNEQDNEVDEMDEAEIEEEMENMSISELEAVLARARQDPDFANIEKKMEEEMMKMFGDKMPGLANLRKRMFIKTARAWMNAKKAGVSPPRRIISPVQQAYLEGIQEALDKEMEIYEKNPGYLPSHLQAVESVKANIQQKAAEDPKFERDLEAVSRKMNTEDQDNLERFFRNLDEERDLGVDGDTNYAREREAPGFFNYGEDVSEELGEDEDFDQDDLTHQGHTELELHRELREYARWTAWELPLLNKLAAKQPFQFPDMKATPLRFRYTTYMGEHHPAAKKVVCEFSPSNLALSPEQRISLIKLAGPRYHASRDVVKMSSDAFETAAQNKRYLGDLVGQMVAAAKDPANEFADLPVDTRFHARKAKPFYAFPEEWKMTPERREALDEQRRVLAKAEERRLLEGSVVDGLNTINKALRGRREPEPVLVQPAGVRKRLS